MPRSVIRSAYRGLAVLVAITTLLALAALPAMAEEGTSTVDPDATRQAAVDRADATRADAVGIIESVSADVPGVAVEAPEIIIEIDPIIIQKNIVVDASINGTPDTVNQTATNSAGVSQDSTAQAGTASAPASGFAYSGGALSGGIVVVTQINVAVVAGYVPEGGVTQDASNVADVDQSAAAQGGDASAAGEDSSAYGGDATALATARVSQFNILWFVGTNPDNTESVNQAGQNAAGVTQSASAVGGDAEAGEDALAKAGGSTDLSRITVEQQNLIKNW